MHAHISEMQLWTSAAAKINTINDVALGSNILLAANVVAGTSVPAMNAAVVDGKPLRVAIAQAHSTSRRSITLRPDESFMEGSHRRSIKRGIDQVKTRLARLGALGSGLRCETDTYEHDRK